MQKRIMALSLFIFVVASLTAFDGNRKGFLLGIGGGVANVSYSLEIEGYGESIESDSFNDNAFATDFKIGYAPNNQLEIYYTNQVAWFPMESSTGLEVTIADGVGAIALSYFIAPELRAGGWHSSLFISGGVGVSTWATPMEEDSDTWEGIGYFVGLGYEFTKHYRVSLNYFGNNPSIEEDGITLTTTSNAFLLTFSGLAF
jgi:hypothetical protein